MSRAGKNQPPAPPADRKITALYVHVPFCAKRCDYCGFYSTAGAPALTRAAWLERLELEIAESANRLGPLSSVFVGGGTPSFLEPAELRQLLFSAIGRLPRQPDCEFTSECNPESLTREKAEILAAAGVNRVSLGVQSFRPRLLRALGRAALPRRVPAAIAILRAAGIANLGVDLIFGIPGQTMRDWIGDLRRAGDLGIRHLSTYALTLEEGTRLAARTAAGAAERLVAAMWERTDEVTAAYGLRRYEVSNFSKPGGECRHNLNTWFGGACLGIGPAASSFDGFIRWTNPHDLAAWLRGQPPELDPLPPPARAREILVCGLRTTRGWTAAGFRRSTGHDYLKLRGAEITALAGLGLLEVRPGRLRPTRRGLLFHDRIAMDLI